jgi:hypothetical protein
MKKFVKMSLVSSLLIAGVSSSALADNTFNLSTPLSDIKVNGQLRARYESVDISNAKKDADTSTLRTKIGISAKVFGLDNLTTYAEMINVSGAGDDYNSVNNGNSTYNTIADPTWSRLTQAYLDYKISDTKLRIGRQALNLDNLRFVGTVDWRQMPQTFTGIMATQKLNDLNLMAAYLTKRHGIIENFETDTKSVLLHADYKIDDAHKFTAYGYLLGSLSNTYGGYLSAKHNILDTNVKMRVEYAKQTDASLEYDDNGKPQNDSDYYRVSVDANNNGFIAGIGYEVLGHDDENNKGFSTPFATLHAQNGWADMFLSTPAEGLKDLTLKIGYKSKRFGKLVAVYHDFEADDPSTTNDDIGSELDVVYIKPLAKSIKLVLKMADFSKGNSSTYSDTKKYWAMVNYSF